MMVMYVYSHNASIFPADLGCQQNTNVVKFYSLLKKDNEDEQQCYYQPGIGTYFQPGVVSPLFQWGAKILDEAVAWCAFYYYNGSTLYSLYSGILMNMSEVATNFSCKTTVRETKSVFSVRQCQQYLYCILRVIFQVSLVGHILPEH